jgi:hypothetical protein
MALKVVPADDERCDIHNARKPAKHICESCLKELGLEAGPATTATRAPIRRARRVIRRGPLRRARRALRRSGWGGHPKVLIGAGAGLLIAAIVVIIVLAGRGGGGETETGPPTEAEVVEALELSPDPSGVGWITLDGECVVVAIQIGNPPTTQTARPPSEAMNEEGTVRAIVLEGFSFSQTECVDRVSDALRENF